MKFQEFVSVGAIRASLESTNKETVIDELVGALVAAGSIEGRSARRTSLSRS